MPIGTGGVSVVGVKDAAGVPHRLGRPCLCEAVSGTQLNAPAPEANRLRKNRKPPDPVDVGVSGADPRL
jgi:hypothetical protein